MKKAVGADGVYILVVEGFEAKAGEEYKFKLRANKSWDGYQLPAGQKNFTWTPEADGIYTLTFTANINENTLELEATKTSINTVAELNALADKKAFKFYGNAIVVAKMAKGNANYVYITDETGSSLIYDADGKSTANIAVGNVLTAPWAGTVSIYNGLFEAKPTEVLGSTSTVEVKYPEVTADDVKAENMNQVVLIKGLTIANVDGSNIKFTIGNSAIVGYNKFGIELPAEYADKTFDVVGAISVYDKTVQFQPITITEVQEPQPAGDTWTVAGSSESLFGIAWDPANKANDMTLTEGLYTWEKTEVTLAAGIVQFKVAKNHDWDEAYPENNYMLNIPADGVYGIKITFNAETKEVKAETTGGPELNTYTASFTTDRGWENVYAYAYYYTPADEAAGTQEHTYAPVEWPGTPMTFNAETGKFEVTIKSLEKPNFIVFNNGLAGEAEQKTPDWEFVDGKAYEYNKPVEKEYTVQFVNAAGWEAVNAFAWNGETKILNVWPGTPMTPINTQKEINGKNYPVYELKFKSAIAPEFIIFNAGEGKAQTEDLEFTDGMQYVELAINGDVVAKVAKGVELNDADNMKLYNGMNKITEQGTVKISAGDQINIRVIATGDDAKVYLKSNDGTALVTEEYSLVGKDVPCIVSIPVTGALYEQLKDREHKVRLNGQNVTIDVLAVEENVYPQPAPEENTVSVWIAEEETVTAKDETVEIPAVSFQVVDVQKEEIVKIKASDAVAPSRGLGGAVTALAASDISILKKGSTTDLLVADDQIRVSEDKSGYEFTVKDDETATELKTNGFDIKNKTEKPLVIKAIEVEEIVPVVINSMAIVGDFLGLEPTTEDPNPNWNPANGWALEKDAENAAIWKKTFENVVVEGKKYEYKATANGNWTDYVLPAGDNANFIFGTEEYPAGKYNLTFTVNTDENTLTLEAVKAVDPEPVFPDGAIVYNFAAASAAAENPANKNGSAANGQGFYVWQSAEAADRLGQDFKGYEWAEGSVLPNECHVWRRSDRINNSVADGGLKCPNDREMAVDGLAAGDKVIIVYDATGAAEGSKEMVWAIGDGSGDESLTGPRATATIGGVDAVIGETAIASGAEITVTSVTPAANGTGYIAFKVKKGMIIKQIAIVKAPAAPNYYLVGKVGNMTEWAPKAENKLTLNTEAAPGVVEYMITLDLATTDMFKIARSDDGTTIVAGGWYPDGMENSYGEHGEITETANYTVYFRPNADGNAGWFYNVIYVVKNGPATGINNIDNDGVAGEKDVYYNLQGVRVANPGKGVYIKNGKKVLVK